MRILVTGGAGYIGSHTCVELLNSGHQVTVIDNLHNSKQTSLHRVQKITKKTLTFHKIDLLDYQRLSGIITPGAFDLVVHFAGLKAVGESVQIPLEYYENNVTGTINLLKAMSAVNLQNIIFSSSATVYGQPEKTPITEDFPVSAASPYGRTKLVIEQILTDFHTSAPRWNIAILRYFNPVGAHPSGLIGEDPKGIPNNLFPFISRVAVGKLAELSVFGNDYPTPDGTGIRDYIHVVDLAKGHVAAISKLTQNPGLVIYNLGTGKGYSVLDIVKAFSVACGKPVPYRIAPRRPGDIATCFADPAKANRELNWAAEKTLADMCADTWRWQSQNPDGYPD